MSALVVDALDVPFGDAAGLTDVSFRVRSGERLVVVGASGAGKTSLLGALAGFVSPSGGRIEMDGHDVASRPPERRPCVLLTQTPLLFPHLTVFENVAFPLRVRRVVGRDVRARVDAALAAVRLESFGDRRPATLSGGQARRVALARAMVSRPKILLLDEPLAALDPSLRESMRRMILQMHADYRPALVMVTHDLAEAGRVADRIGVLVGGGLEQIGTPEEVFRRPATLQVARFIGLRNELVGEVRSGTQLVVGEVRLSLPGCRSPRPETGMGEGPRDRLPVSLVFGVQGARLVPDGCPASYPVDRIPARVESVLHAPEGTTARLTTDHGPVEVRVDTAEVPAAGTAVQLQIRLDEAHVFERSSGSRFGARPGLDGGGLHRA
ncbi:MAG: ABC transporter ATP-binding protein [Gemmatimonadota bacterium]